MEQIWVEEKNVFAVSFDGEEKSVEENRIAEKVINYSPSSMSGGGGGGGGGSR